MSDLFLVLAQEPEGLGCFLVPRVLPDGSRNAFALQRLKDKLGNRANASSEVEFDGTVGWRVGEAGRGLTTILDMVTMTRLDCVISAAALQQAAVAEARHHAAHRYAFGALLSDQPLMQEVLADLTMEAEAAAALFLRLATAVDRGEYALLRLAVAAAKFWVCRRTPAVVGEALECLGGAGFVEESALPRYFRESPLNSIWEGSGNVIALDVLRAVRREPAAVAAVRQELREAAGQDARMAVAVADLEAMMAGHGHDVDADQRGARRLASRMAVLLQAAALLAAADGLPNGPAVAERYLATVVADSGGGVAGDRGAAGAANTRSVMN